MSAVQINDNRICNYYGDGEFGFVANDKEREMLKNAHWAVTQCESWNWLRTFNEESFLLSTSPILHRIMEKIVEHGEGRLHSGASFACTMRVMEYIAKNGYAAFEKRR
jgi:hypothetical protein